MSDTAIQLISAGNYVVMANADYVEELRNKFLITFNL